MFNIDLVEILVGLIIIVFNAGGVFYLAKNHFAHVNAKLDAIAVRLGYIEQRVARLEGALSFPRNLTEN
jgi:hypothetical protein